MFDIRYLLHCLTYAMIAVILGILIGDLGNRRSEESVEFPAVTMEPKASEFLQAIPTKEVTELTDKEQRKNEKPEPYRERLKRFDTFRSKVFLKDGEAIEKQRLLANVKTIQWIESQLSASPDNGKEALADRLLMIDFVKEALAWTENPARSEVFDSLERTLKVNNLRAGSKETKQMLVGDKIELFAVLAQQDPARAKLVLETTKDRQLMDIFHYATERLALQKLSENAR